MKLKVAKRKPIFIACCMAAAVILAVVLLLSHSALPNDYSDPDPSTDKPGENTAASFQTPSTEEANVGQEPAETGDSQPNRKGTVRIRSYSTFRELGSIIKRYAEEHWDFFYVVLDNTDAMVYSYLDIVNIVCDNLKNNTEPMELFCVPPSYMSLFTKGKFSEYVLPYEELGIDVEALVEKMDIPQYILEAGTNRDGKIVALPVYANANVLMYRRSVAKEVFGTDDPDRIAEIIGGGTQSWDKFMEAAQTLKKHGYYIVSGCTELSDMLNTGCTISELFSENFRPDPQWEAFMDVSKFLYDNGCIKDTQAWSEEWFANIKGERDRVFGLIINTGNIFFLDGLNYEKTYGDWAICLPPFQIPADWYSGIFVSRHAENKQLLKPLIEWITLDSSENGFQYRLAHGTMFADTNYSVVSGAVMKESISSCGIIDGQNMNPIISQSMDILDSLDGTSKAFQYINYDFPFQYFMNETRAYIRGEKDKETAISDFITGARDYWKNSASKRLNLFGE